MRGLLAHLSEPVLRAVGMRWFLLGFALSGRGFHGECCPPAHPMVRRLLAAEFGRRWGEEELLARPVKNRHGPGVNDYPHPDDER